MKTIRNIITRKKTYANIVDGEGNVVMKGREVNQMDLSTSRNTLGMYYLGGPLQVTIEKFQVEVCSYSKIRQYRRLEGGYKPVLTTKYRYTYVEDRKSLTSRDFNSLEKLRIEVKEKTSNSEMGVTEPEVLQTDIFTL